MEKIRWEIWVKTVEGDEFIAFHWTRDADSGIARARVEAPKFGFKVVEIWAIEK